MNTKQPCLINILFLCAVVEAVCQNAVVQATYPNDVVRTIVREYSYPATVSYVETAVEHYFAYADATMSVTNSEISHDLYVTDLALHGTFAYFCGYNTVSGLGVWGWFDISSLMAGSLSYYIYDDFRCNVLYADSLFSLALYEEQGQLHIATVGSTTDGASKKRACLIDITGAEGTASGWNYRMGLSECEFNYFNRLTEVCVTDKYIVAAGSTILSFCSEGYRFHLRSNPFMAGGPQDSLYFFPRVTTYYSSPDHNGEDLAMTHISGDVFASAVYCYTNNINQKEGILVNVYDISQILTVPWTSPIYSKYTNIPGNSFYINDLIYNKTSNSLYLLTNGQIASYMGSFITELSLPLPTTISPIYVQDVYLTSLDNYNSQQSFLAQGYDGNNPQRITYYTQPLSTAPLCATPQPSNTNDADYGAKTHYCPYTVCNGVFNCSKTPQAAKLTIPIEIICEQP